MLGKNYHQVIGKESKIILDQDWVSIAESRLADKAIDLRILLESSLQIVDA